MVAPDPLHRSGRAALPHPAPALGHYAKTLQRVWVADSSQREPSIDVSLPFGQLALASVDTNEAPAAIREAAAIVPVDLEKNSRREKLLLVSPCSELSVVLCFFLSVIFSSLRRS